MIDRQASIVTYAAGASLAAIALVYVLGPTLFSKHTDADEKSVSKAVGLVNKANDCFINCILQATTGLSELRNYLIRELDRRQLDEPSIYALTREDLENEVSNRGPPAWKLEGLRRGDVTRALKEIFDRLNDPLATGKTITAADFIHAMEMGFGTRISRHQQDAQEFLQIVLERLYDEHRAGVRARQRAKNPKASDDGAMHNIESGSLSEQRSDGLVENLGDLEAAKERPLGPQPLQAVSRACSGFPIEGKTESVIRCETCNFSPKSTAASFVVLSLNIPETRATTLNACLDGLLKVERIEDYICDRCWLRHALEMKSKELNMAKDGNRRRKLEIESEKIRAAILEDPETPPEDILLPDRKTAPKRRVERHTRIAQFPKVLAIHLSRSLFSVGFSNKNEARVSFPEVLPLGGLLEQRKYRLSAIVAHRGGHHSGHYETFRRKSPPQASSSLTSPDTGAGCSTANTPLRSGVDTTCMNGLSPEHLSRTQSPRAKADQADARELEPATTKRSSSVELGRNIDDSQGRRTQLGQTGSSDAEAPTRADKGGTKSKQKRRESKWWRISDDRVKESTTKEALGMQKEVYLLFYELMDVE